jgi:hypothetical protein
VKPQRASEVGNPHHGNYYRPMDVTSDSAPARRPHLAQRVAAAASGLDALSKIAIVCLIIAWFFTDTLVVTLGTVKHGVPFYDMSALIGDPSRMFFSIDTTLSVIAFGLLCCVCLLAPLLSHLRRERLRWFAYWAPLCLILVCGLLVYSRTSSEFFTAPAAAGSLGSKVVRFANSLVHQGSDLVTRHVAVGFGGYLGLLAGLALAIQGVRGFRAPRLGA